MDRGGIRRVHSPWDIIIRDKVGYANIKPTGITYAEPKELLPPAVECAEYSGPLRIMVTLNINLILYYVLCTPYINMYGVGTSHPSIPSVFDN